jgi:hypothetical protein
VQKTDTKLKWWFLSCHYSNCLFGLKTNLKIAAQALHFRVARFFLVEHTKTGKMYQNNHKIYQIATNYTKWPQTKLNGNKLHQMAKNIPTLSTAKPSKIYQNRDFWFEKSGNPATFGLQVECKLKPEFVASLSTWRYVILSTSKLPTVKMSTTKL